VTFNAKDIARQSRNQRNVANKVARASRPCVSVTGDNFAETHRRDACATTLPEKFAQTDVSVDDQPAREIGWNALEKTGLILEVSFAVYPLRRLATFHNWLIQSVCSIACQFNCAILKSGVTSR
jgi:hypothetical protein